jgi:hypothetical protein
MAPAMECILAPIQNNNNNNNNNRHKKKRRALIKRHQQDNLQKNNSLFLTYTLKESGLANIIRSTGNLGELLERISISCSSLGELTLVGLKMSCLSSDVKETSCRARSTHLIVADRWCDDTLTVIDGLNSTEEGVGITGSIHAGLGATGQSNRV